MAEIISLGLEDLPATEPDPEDPGPEMNTEAPADPEALQLVTDAFRRPEVWAAFVHLCAGFEYEKINKDGPQAAELQKQITQAFEDYLHALIAALGTDGLDKISPGQFMAAAGQVGGQQAEQLEAAILAPDVLMNSSIYKPLCAEIDGLDAYISKISKQSLKDPETAACLQTLEEFIEEAMQAGADLPADIRAYKHREGLQSITAEDLFSGPEGARPCDAILQTARAPRISAKTPETIQFPIDPVNGAIWGLRRQEGTAALSADINAKRRNDKKNRFRPVNISYIADFTKLVKEAGLDWILKDLTDLDKVVCILAWNYFQAGTDTMTEAMLYRAIGGQSKPNSRELKVIDDSLRKMGSLWIKLDNAQELKAGYKYPRFYYEGVFLPVEFNAQAKVNGRITAHAIHLYREPPLMQFARLRGQVTTIPAQALQSPTSLTPRIVSLQNYLIDRIARGDAGANTLNYETIFEHCGISTKKQRHDAREQILTLLEHFLQCKMITGYGTTEAGIVFYKKLGKK